MARVHNNMTTINVAAIHDQDCALLSASQFELGPDAGKITWRNALALAERNPRNDSNRDEVRGHFAEYGAWEREEIAAWTDTELSAMIWQEAANDYRHYAEACKGDLAAYERACEQGQVSGRLMLGEETADIYLGC